MDYSSTKGRIFDIQRFSIHDGPGIRTIVFLKGCPLRCKWCCNPESQRFEIEQMAMNGKVKTVGRDVTAGEVIDEVERDRMYYKRSGGGLTLSGGETLTQPDFAVALLALAHERGITTAIESTGFADFSVIERILPHLDLYLMDIKHINSDKHKAFTGQPNDKILANAQRIARSPVKLIIRTPVVPGFNDTEEEISAIARFAASLPGVEEMHLLPYHRIGSDKYKGLGREYSLSHIEPPPQDHMQKLLEVVNKCGVRGQIGG